MAWFLALQGPAQPSHQSSVYRASGLHRCRELAQELVSAVTLDRVVPIPAMLPRTTARDRRSRCYVRPAAWGMWTFYELSEEDRRQLMRQPSLNAIQQHQREHTAGRTRWVNLLGRANPDR